MLFVLVLFASLVVASFFGHVVHWILHQKWAGAFHRAHMDHHLTQYPPGRLASDRYRSAKWYRGGPFLFTPPLVVILVSTGGLLWRLGAPFWCIWVFGAVVVGFGLFNDYVHDAYHLQSHRLNRFGWYKRGRRLHFYHHVHMDKNFGIVFFFWDRVLGTTRKARQLKS